jgi:hypothetical protein
MVFHQHWEPKGHTFGTCMSHQDSDLMYVNIPKNASSWTKPNLKDLGWEFYNYHFDHLTHKHALIVLRDPVERWLSGVCEYFTLYHRNIDTTQFNQAFYDLLLEQVTFDDHTEKQVYFIEGLDPRRCTFFNCDSNYRLYFGQFLKNQGVDNRYANYNYQHTTENRDDGDNTRSEFKKIFAPLLDNPKYLNHIKQHYKKDYELINSVQFYHG